MEEKLLNILSEAQQARESKDFDAAINLYEEALRLPVPDDDKAMLFEFIGQCYDKQGKEHLAFEILVKYLNLTQNMKMAGIYFIDMLT